MKTKLLNANFSWTEFGYWHPCSICSKKSVVAVRAMCTPAAIAKSSAIGIADGHEKCRHLAEPTARPIAAAMLS